MKWLILFALLVGPVVARADSAALDSTVQAVIDTLDVAWGTGRVPPVVMIEYWSPDPDTKPDHRPIVNGRMVPQSPPGTKLPNIAVGFLEKDDGGDIFLGSRLWIRSGLGRSYSRGGVYSPSGQASIRRKQIIRIIILAPADTSGVPVWPAVWTPHDHGRAGSER